MGMKNPYDTHGFAFADLDGAPSTPDEIDVDRTVWDPAYRSAAIGVLIRDDESDETLEVLQQR